MTELGRGPSKIQGMTDHEIVYMPLSELTSAARNPKLHDEAGIRASIQQHGMAEPPLIDERTGRLAAGHGRRDQLVALRAAGGRPPGGVRVDEASGEWLVPVVRGWASTSDAAAEAYLIGSNKLTMIGGWDEGTLVAMLADLAEEGMLELTGFVEDELAAMEGGGEPDSERVEFEATDATSWDMVVSCRSERDREALMGRLVGEGFDVKTA